jgi:hypothetical protein
MPDSKHANDVAGYAAAVRAALSTLPDGERDSLIEDLENHLAEVASESGLPLRERLGEPEEYAEELKYRRPGRSCPRGWRQPQTYPIPIAIAMWLTNIPRSRRAAVQGLAAVALTMDPLSYEGVESRRNYPPAAARAEDSWRRDEPWGECPEGVQS